MANNLDRNYRELLEYIIRFGVEKKDRTGTGTKSIFGWQIRHNMKEGFPLLTTKKMYFKGIVAELLWFLRGDTNIKSLIEDECHIWNGDAYKNYLNKSQFSSNPHDFKIKSVQPTEINGLSGFELDGQFTMEEFIDKIKTDAEFAKKWGELGPIYGRQWRGWGAPHKHMMWSDGIDQIANLINDLKTNPDSRRLMVNAWNVGELNKMVLPPCFTEDMVVACVDGYRKISELTINDLVLTEDGSYQKVYDLHETKYNGDLIKFKAFGNTKHIMCTPNHPFLIKNKGYINANEITGDDYLAIPINKESIIPSFDVWLKDNQYSEKLVTTKLDNVDYWFLMGYFLGDGWLIDSKEEVYFTIKNEQTDLILPRLKNIIGLAKLNNSGVNCTKYVGKKKQVFDILSHFGKYAEGKFIPKFVHDAPREYIEQFIEGYLMADGCKTKDGICYTTVSENIAYGLQLLYAKLGIKASVYFQDRHKKTIIEGRVVNQKNTFLINVYKQKNKTKKYILDSDYLWVKIKEINKVNFSGYVYNISVENNHTYNVYNLINHNCHYGFQVYTRELSNDEIIEYYYNNINTEAKWKKMDGKYFHYSEELNMWVEHSTSDIVFGMKPDCPKRAISLMWNQRSVDTFLGLPFNIASYGLLLEIIAKTVNMIPEELICNLGDTHLYNNHIEQAKEQLGWKEDYIELRKTNPELNEIYEKKIAAIKSQDYHEAAKYRDEERAILDKIYRTPFPLPTLKHMKTDAFYKSLSTDFSLITHLDISDFVVENYQSHPAIKAPLSN